MIEARSATANRLAYVPAHAHPPFRTAAVLGAGTMGAQIAAHLANAGVAVLLLDIPSPEGDRNAVVKRGLAQAANTRPAPFFADETARRIDTGNFEDDLFRIAGVEWIIEAVVERIDVKRSLMEQVERHISEDTIVSTNTSGIPIEDIAEGRSTSFRRRFLGTHFFNPPRYLKLLELVPSAHTDPAILERIGHFGRIHLGKGIVLAKDTPYFIGNRIGVYGMLQAMRYFTEGRYSIEEIDLLTGPLTGRPRSATFRTADIVGLDVMLDVADNLFEAVPGDESREAFRAPELLRRLVENGSLGQKAGAGFYKKEGREIRSIDPALQEYRQSGGAELGDLSDIQRKGDLSERLRTLFADEGRAGEFFRETTLDLLSYSARRIPEISDNPADVDRAIRWGFGWEMGPFEIWDALGFEAVVEAMHERETALPEWLDDMSTSGYMSFYEREEGPRRIYVPSERGYVEDEAAPDELRIEILRSSDRHVLWTNDEAVLLDAGEGVVLYEFRSKANALGGQVIDGLREAIDRVEGDRTVKGMIIGNEGKHFSVGANLKELVSALMKDDLGGIEDYLERFQETIHRVRYARKPIVVAVHRMALGGACELVMACPHPVAAAESYLGLVELGVGLIPAGTGTTRLAALASERSPGGHASEIQGWIQKFFETVAQARVSGSAVEAQHLGFLPHSARVAMNEDRRLFVAREEVLRLSHQGYMPPPRAGAIRVLGRPSGAALEVAARQYLEGGFISEYDAYLAGRFARVLTGGDLTAPQDVPEEYLLELERDVFYELLRQEKTRSRIEHMLKTNKPLRN